MKKIKEILNQIETKEGKKYWIESNYFNLNDAQKGMLYVYFNLI